jgi:RNA polymerase sigma factor (sigma-70 family)
MPALTRTRPIARRALAAQSDERLVRLLREGYAPAFEEIVRRYQHPLVAFAAAIVPFHRAEDVVQGSLFKAHEALLADDRDVSLRAWLFTIVRNGALNVIRDEPDWQELDPSYDGVPQPPAVAEQNEELKALVTAICALPEAQRTALVGREIEGEGHAELAAQLGTTSTAVRGLIFRARTALRNTLGAAIPLPILRLLLVEVPAVGAGIGAGIGGATLGGGTKLAAAISAAVLAVGGGVAIQQGGGERSNQARAADEARLEGPAVAPASKAARAATSAAPAGSDGLHSGGGSQAAKDGSGDGDHSSGSGGGDDNSGPAGGESEDDGGSSGPGGGEKHEDGGGGHSGSGGGGHSGSGNGEPEEEGGSSGSGKSGDGSTGKGGTEPEEQSGFGGLDPDNPTHWAE